MRKILFNSRLAFLLTLVMLFSVSIWGQAGTSTVTGTVSDAQGNAVPNATVTLISSEQNSRRTSVTSDSGTYTFTALQPGAYQIEVEGQGFKKTTVSSFQALVDKSTQINVNLEIGAVTETVNVDASGIESIVNTQDASLGNNFVAEQIEQLPLNARNVANLLSLQAAVTPDGEVAGGRSDQSNITLDGVDVNNQQTGLDPLTGEAFAPVLRVNPDSVDEFRVTTSNPNANQGRSSGAQVSLVTKSGTNNFRGALYEYHRNTITTANRFFNNLSGVPREKLLRNNFGARLGGPIVKDRLFFFYNYEGFREAKSTSISRLVPTASLAAGNLRFYDSAGNLVTLNAAQINGLTLDGQDVVNINPLVTQLFSGAASRYVANVPGGGTGDGLNTGNFRFNAPAPVRLNTHTARFDWNVTSDQRHQLSLRGNYQSDVTGGLPFFPDTPATNTWSHPIGIAATHTWLINSNMTNRFSYGLTRLAFTNQGDSTDNAVIFRNVFQPVGFSRGLSRVNPTHNFVDDFTWLKGDHTIQFGTNVRIVRNKRTGLANSYDTAIANYSAYAEGGLVFTRALNTYLQNTTGDPNRTVDPAWELNVGTALASLFGGLSQYTANFNFDLNGRPLASGTPIVREFATEEYDFYVQDVWKFRPNITLTGGLRYGLSRPVYETQGYQTVPDIPLQEYLQRRIDAAARGQNYTEPLRVILAGPANGGRNFYDWDKNNFQPRLAVAWSPNFSSGFFSKLFGKKQESVFRAGAAITNDYFGQALAVNFDGANTLGFSSSYNTSVNTYNITTGNAAPNYTGPGQPVRTLPGVVVPGTLTFPQLKPVSGTLGGLIETSLDTNLVSPINYTWNVSYGRQLPGKMYVEGSYIGRLARNLLAGRDVMAFNNIRDPRSGQTFYEAARILELQRRAGVPRAQVAAQPFFENMYGAGEVATAFFGAPVFNNTQAVYAALPSLGDWTYTQAYLDDLTSKYLFGQGQYSALSAFGTIAKSDYHAAAFSVRQRLKGLTWDLNYTYSKSMDNASGVQSSGLFAGSAFILNALDPEGFRAVSDFDLTHIVNFNSVWDVPIGRGRRFGKNLNPVVNALIGGWQLSSIFRYDSGLPFRGYEDGSGWQTNWQVRSIMVRRSELQTSASNTGGTTLTGGRVPNLYSNPDAAYASFRTPLPGETGDRNQLRFPHYIVLDAGLAKSFQMPWNENHRATFRWDVFNVTNTPVFGGQANGLIGYSGRPSARPTNWGNFTGERSEPRIMQFALRYDF
jgi:Carboxypeptidase regulatory-like domain